jgi:hypothetical protein
MNLLSRVLSLLLLVSAALLYTNCGGDDDPEKSVEEVQLDKLKAAQWTLLSANDGTDRTSEYPGMTLTISGTFSPGGSYSYTSNATSWPTLSPWNEVDTWKFKAGAEGNTIIRLSDSQEMTYTLANSDKQLTINFTYSGGGFDNGRVEVVEGNWSFVFTRP